MSSKEALFSIRELIPVLSAQVLSAGKTGRSLDVFDEVTEVTIDSRSLEKGQAFVALKGKNYDGHDFVPQAIEKGASVCFIHRWDKLWEPLREKGTFVLVSDTLVALQEMAHFHRKRRSAKVLSVTGSNGKTSTKEFAFKFLSSFYPTHCNEGNFNNHIGASSHFIKIKGETCFLHFRIGHKFSGGNGFLSSDSRTGDKFVY